MTRCETLRTTLTWSQPDMARFLRMNQSAVSRMEGGGPESGPTSWIFDRLAAALECGVIVAPCSVDEALAGLTPCKPSASASNQEAAE